MIKTNENNNVLNRQSNVKHVDDKHKAKFYRCNNSYFVKRFSRSFFVWSNDLLIKDAADISGVGEKLVCHDINI